MTDPDAVQPGLFDEPAHRLPHPSTRVVLLCGPSGSGKTSLTRRLGLPVLALDDFYRDVDDDRPQAPLPRRFGIVDWDDPRSWDADAAMDCLLDLCAGRRAQVPVYDISLSRRTGVTHLEVDGSPLLLAEGIFAAQLVDRCRQAGILADAVCLDQRPALTFWRRLGRDLAESRKPPWTLLRRGLALMRDEPRLVAHWASLGCRRLSPPAAEAHIHALRAQASAA
ncbi:uridine kinase [Quadrisphaera sp. GCM10027208]|uniref:uridine kinase family protein n=1 Tax=Quadrisphaera sp. GCM10027208 TaxID=3273423 RepID=UPI003606C38F